MASLRESLGFPNLCDLQQIEIKDDHLMLEMMIRLCSNSTIPYNTRKVVIISPSHGSLPILTYLRILM